MRIFTTLAIILFIVFSFTFVGYDSATAKSTAESAPVAKLFCTLSLAEEITHSLSRRDIDPKQAAKQVKFNGPIDSAYSIGNVLVIISNGDIHAYGKGDKMSLIREQNDRKEHDIDDEYKPFNLPTVFQYPKYSKLCIDMTYGDGKRSCYYNYEVENKHYREAIRSLQMMKLINNNIMEDSDVAACELFNLMINELSYDEVEKYKYDIQGVKEMVIKLNPNCNISGVNDYH
jgi:hypothetical protein